MGENNDNWWGIPLSRSAAAGVADDTALVCITIRTSVGKGLHTLPFQPTLGGRKGFPEEC